MTKPHEETWTIDDDMVAVGDFSASDADGFCAITAYGSEDGPAGDARAEARLRLAAAAPEMAREMLSEMRPCGDGLMHHDSCPVVIGSKGCADACARKRHILRRAGVL